MDRKLSQTEYVNRKTEKISATFIPEAEIMGFGKRFLTLYLYLKNINFIERFFCLVRDFFFKWKIHVHFVTTFYLATLKRSMGGRCRDEIFPKISLLLLYPLLHLQALTVLDIIFFPGNSSFLSNASVLDCISVLGSVLFYFLWTKCLLCSYYLLF